MRFSEQSKNGAKNFRSNDLFLHELLKTQQESDEVLKIQQERDEFLKIQQRSFHESSELEALMLKWKRRLEASCNI